MKQGWEIAEFENCLEKVTYTNKIQRKNFKEEGICPIISQEKDFINGYWDNEDDLFRVDKPVVIFGDHTQVIKFIDFDFVLGADGVKILKPKDKIDPKYFYYFLQNIDLGSLGYARHYRLLKEINVAYPKSLPEQHHIVAILDKCFAAIDKAKANAEQNLKNAKELFESYLQGVFENVCGWEEKKLGEIVEYDKKQSVHKGLPYVGLENIESNSGRFIGSLKPLEVKSSTFYFNKEHVLYGRLRPYLNKVLLPDFEGHCSTEIFPIKIKKEISREFLFYWLIASATVKKINATWTGARMPRANMNQVLDFVFSFPKSKADQQSIVRQLDTLRAETKKLKSIYQNKLDYLEELKKSILQKAFAGELSNATIKDIEI